MDGCRPQVSDSSRGMKRWNGRPTSTPCQLPVLVVKETLYADLLPCIFLRITVCTYIHLFPCISFRITVCTYICFPVYLFVSLYVYISVSLYISSSHCVYICFPVYFYLSYTCVFSSITTVLTKCSDIPGIKSVSSHETMTYFANNIFRSLIICEITNITAHKYIGWHGQKIAALTLS